MVILHMPMLIPVGGHAIYAMYVVEYRVLYCKYTYTDRKP